MIFHIFFGCFHCVLNLMFSLSLPRFKAMFKINLKPIYNFFNVAMDENSTTNPYLIFLMRKEFKFDFLALTLLNKMARRREPFDLLIIFFVPFFSKLLFHPSFGLKLFSPRFTLSISFQQLPFPSKRRLNFFLALVLLTIIYVFLGACAIQIFHLPLLTNFLQDLLLAFILALPLIIADIVALISSPNVSLYLVMSRLMKITSPLLIFILPQTFLNMILSYLMTMCLPYLVCMLLWTLPLVIFLPLLHLLLLPTHPHLPHLLLSAFPLLLLIILW